jgi:hypothetical protein
MNTNIGSIISITNDQTLMTINDEEYVGSSNIYARLCKLNCKNFQMYPSYTQSQPSGISEENIILSGSGTLQILNTLKNMTYTFLLRNVRGTYMISNMMLLIV